MNPIVLRQMRTVLRERTLEFRDKFRIFSVDTSAKPYAEDPPATCRSVAKRILDLVADSVEEKILSAPKSSFAALQKTIIAKGEEAAQLVRKFEKEGEFRPRKRVESDLNRLQPLPIVVVRNKSGHILRLVRKEREPTNKLHSKITVWAGGHVRREDGPNLVGAIIGGAQRELEEELRIYAPAEALHLIGAIYVPAGGSTAKHVAFVYEWQASTDDVQVALCNAEFFEKSGTSLKGQFLPAEKIVKEPNLEDWSKEILTHLLMPRSMKKATVRA